MPFLLFAGPHRNALVAVFLRKGAVCTVFADYLVLVTDDATSQYFHK